MCSVSSFRTRALCKRRVSSTENASSSVGGGRPAGGVGRDARARERREVCTTGQRRRARESVHWQTHAASGLARFSRWRIGSDTPGLTSATAEMRDKLRAHKLDAKMPTIRESDQGLPARSQVPRPSSPRGNIAEIG